ncbi:MAG: hypothetical protein AAF944_29230 [Bacteroidota bacterium]
MVVLFIINLVKRSLAIELDDLFGFLHREAAARLLFQPKGPLVRLDISLRLFFQDWNRCLVVAFYRINATRVNRWQGFRVFGIDGSRAYLPDFNLMRKEFGIHANQSKKFPMAQMIAAAAFRFVG